MKLNEKGRNMAYHAKFICQLAQSVEQSADIGEVPSSSASCTPAFYLKEVFAVYAPRPWPFYLSHVFFLLFYQK